MWIIWLLMLILPVFSETVSDFQPEDYEVDLKDEFFRHLRSSDVSSKGPDYFQNLPKPGGFRSIEDNTRHRRYIDGNPQYSDDARIRRSYHILPSAGLKSHFVLASSDSKQKQRRVKRQTEEKKDIKPNEKLPKRSEKILAEEPSNEFEINDFIRFKRDDDAVSRLKRDQEIRKSLTMDRDGTEREPRGATKEQWLKQPYPVERGEEDNVPSASDNIRAPRVHFVTQRRPNSDSRQPPPPPPPGPAFHSATYPVFRPYDDRGARSRDFDPYVQPLPHNYPRPRSYDPYNSRYYDPYYDRFDGRRYGPDDFEPRYKYPEPDFRATLPPFVPVPNKQKRIIYYATLPEVVHTSPSADHRYTYQYQDSYDDRYMSVPPGSNAPAVSGSNSADTYRIRKSYGNQLQKHREYERPRIDRQKKTPLYPVKVSTDVNVRETKKTPERKIYSETNGNYNYKAESGNF